VNNDECEVCEVYNIRKSKPVGVEASTGGPAATTFTG